MVVSDDSREGSYTDPIAHQVYMLAQEVLAPRRPEQTITLHSTKMVYVQYILNPPYTKVPIPTVILVAVFWYH